MAKKLYQNKDTGELLSYEEMLKQWAEEYDGDDPSNGLGWAEQYEELTQINAPRLELGQTVQTRGIYEACEADASFFNEVAKAFTRYTRGDWGDLDAEDKKANEDAIAYGSRVLGAYETSKGKVYIITEADRSATTVLFASEY